MIFITLKDLKKNSWQETLGAVKRLIAKEFERHRYLLEGETLTNEEKEDYFQILRKKDGKALLEDSLFLLSEWLHRYHKKQVILLIDEYDAPATPHTLENTMNH